ncbi:ANR family transcriptional regulator [Mangrovibacter plantisponsor]|uniref:ANR family transcriptional regulator n=1 Tax=Mangrovibacter plantisponsor TaxID=451513 RepID=A0A317PZU1_9ENTR|nr:ANR family transcriptional regulator [Mangrovibacter plantisponsor]PWW07818.1 hypothetical protein DES37_108246 [Mangrovibacter plantisponsor]
MGNALAVSDAAPQNDKVTYNRMADKARGQEQSCKFNAAAELWLEAKVLARLDVNRNWAEGRYLHCAHMCHLLEIADEYGRSSLPQCCRQDIL